MCEPDSIEDEDVPLETGPDSTADEDVPLGAIEIEATGEVEMQALLKHIDKRKTKQGKVYYVETVVETVPEQVNWQAKFALCVVRKFDSDGDFEGEFLQVRRRSEK
jgi:hypothetical protein